MSKLPESISRAGMFRDVDKDCVADGEVICRVFMTQKGFGVELDQGLVELAKKGLPAAENALHSIPALVSDAIKQVRGEQ